MVCSGGWTTEPVSHFAEAVGPGRGARSGLRPSGGAIMSCGRRGAGSASKTQARVRDRPGGANIGLIDLTARYALDNGFHVLVEGILYADRYGTMLQDLVRAHRGVSRCYYLHAPYTETVLRHATKPDAEYLKHVTEDHLRDWYREKDLLPDTWRPSSTPPAHWTAQSSRSCARAAWTECSPSTADSVPL